jgi:transmembrane sensor
MEKKFKNLLIKYFRTKLSISEQEKLYNMANKNPQIFKEYTKINYYLSLTMNEFDLQKGKDKIIKHIQIAKRKDKALKVRKLIIAASIALLIGFSFINDFSVKQSPKSSVSISPGTNKAILTLDNGDQIVLGDNNHYENEILKSNQNKISYSNSSKLSDNIAFNILSVPRGGQFRLTLQDGTNIFLNSGSKIKYPVKFKKGEKREVELYYGEAYFDVSDSKINNGSEFSVITKSQVIRVLGTQFNIKAYSEDKFIATTLVEGKIKVRSGTSELNMKPNQQSLVELNKNNIQISEVDIQTQIAWINGLFSFEEESLESIILTLSRWYNFEYVFEEEKSKNYLFTGTLERTKSIKDILSLIEKTSSSNEIKFKINNNKITVN